MRAAWLWSALVATGCASDVVVLSWQAESGDAAVPPDAAAADAGTSRLLLGSAFDHTCAARDGQLHCWGRNREGQLGVGDRADHAEVQRVSLDGSVVAACAGEAHSCALTDDGALHCWGANLHGELGLGDLAARTRPARIEGVRFVRIACGGYDSCAIRADGALFCWGDNFEGKLGQDDAFTAPDSSTPRQVAAGTAFYDVSVGQGHVCAVTRDGALYCWGRNSDSQLGSGQDADQLRAPTRVGSGSDYRAVAAGQRHSCAIRAGGSVWCWGTDSDGSLGVGLPAGSRAPTPLQVNGATGFRSLSANWFHTCGLRDDGALLCWGRNAEGQLGLGDTTSRARPARVGSASDWLAVSAGHFHSCALAPGGVSCWGENDELGQLGIGPVGRKQTPTPVPF